MYRVYDLNELNENLIFEANKPEELKEFLRNYNEETKEMVTYYGVNKALLIMNGIFENDLKTIRLEKVSMF